MRTLLSLAALVFVLQTGFLGGAGALIGLLVFAAAYEDYKVIKEKSK